MATVQKSTMRIEFKEPLESVEGRKGMELFCNETVRLINRHLKEKSLDKEAFDGLLSYGWMQIPEQAGLYCVQVLGPHTHHHVREVGHDLQAEADKGQYGIAITVIRG